MNINLKFVILAALLLAFFLGLFTILDVTEKNKLEALFKSQEESRCLAIDRIVTLVGSSLASYVYDYTYWDEMVNFLEKPDPKWAELNIDASLATYKAAAAWVYKTNGELAHSANSPKDAYLEALPVPAEAIGILFARKRFCHFFVNTPGGLMEIRGASVHPSADPERKTEPKGYFFAGRLWDKKFLMDISGMTDTEARLLPISFGEEHKKITDPKEGVMIFPIMLSDWKGNPLITVELVSVAKSILTFNSMSKGVFNLLLLYSAVALTVVALVTFAWLRSPLAHISRALASDNASYIEGLSLKKDEFGRVAALIKKFFKQRELLSHEIAVRKKSEDALRTEEKKFAGIFYSVPVPLVISMIDSGVFVEVNNAFVEMFGYKKEELIGRSSIETGILKEEDREKVRKMASSTGIYRGEIVMHTKTGLEKAFSVSSNVVRLDAGDCLVSSVIDITENKIREGELKRKMDELEHFNKIAVGRELKMVELKSRLQELEEKLKRQG